MTDRPIIFSAPMVRALLDGRKTQTRRLASAFAWQRVQPGDRLWVREAFNTFGGGDPGVLVWAADWRENAKARGLDNIPETEPKWRPSIHMPRSASRLTLTVTDVRRQRLQDITRGDAKAEGVPRLHPIADDDPSTPIDAFGDLWDALHGEGAWDANPEVIALTFTVERRKIDLAQAGEARRAETALAGSVHEQSNE